MKNHMVRFNGFHGRFSQNLRIDPKKIVELQDEDGGTQFFEITERQAQLLNRRACGYSECLCRETVTSYFPGIPGYFILATEEEIRGNYPQA
jgi:hypothetical protein